MDPCGQRDELLPRTRPGQGGVAHVVRDVETIVVDPDRPALLVRHRHQPAPKPRHERQAREHELAYLGDPEPPVGIEERCAFEHADRSDVHWILGAFKVQEARIEGRETVVMSHLGPIVERTVATVYGVDLVPTAVWNLSPELVLALDEHLGPPVDSYVNGSQTWLVGDEPEDGVADTDALVLEFRMHPVAGYRLPAGFSHYDVWETVVGQLSQGVDPQALRLGTEVRPLSALWDGLEVFPAYGDEVEPARLVGIVTAAIALAPARSGLVDHQAIGDAWERANGTVSIVALLVDQLTS